MVFYARFNSPLGPALLCSEHEQLTGLYFIGQKDCPPVHGLDVCDNINSLRAEQAGARAERAAGGRPGPDAADPADPTSGRKGGMPIRLLKVRRREPNEDLFSPDNIRRTGGNQPARNVEPDTVTLGPLDIMQDGTPAATCEVFCQAHRQLYEYFNGARTVFSVPLLLQGSVFQKRVWEALLTIPYGEYVSYGDIALAAGLTRQHGRPVGKAVGQNPITILVPCHRVLSGTGRLNGYTGGLDRKLALLELEGFETA